MSLRLVAASPGASVSFTPFVVALTGPRPSAATAWQARFQFENGVLDLQTQDGKTVLPRQPVPFTPEASQLVLKMQARLKQGVKRTDGSTNLTIQAMHPEYAPLTNVVSVTWLPLPSLEVTPQSLSLPVGKSGAPGAPTSLSVVLYGPAVPTTQRAMVHFEFDDTLLDLWPRQPEGAQQVRPGEPVSMSLQSSDRLGREMVVRWKGGAKSPQGPAGLRVRVLWAETELQKQVSLTWHGGIWSSWPSLLLPLGIGVLVVGCLLVVIR